MKRARYRYGIIVVGEDQWAETRGRGAELERGRSLFFAATGAAGVEGGRSVEEGARDGGGPFALSKHWVVIDTVDLQYFQIFQMYFYPVQALRNVPHRIYSCFKIRMCKMERKEISTVIDSIDLQGVD